MKRKDLRKVGRNVNENIRRTAVNMVRKQGIKPTVVTKHLKLSSKIIYLWLRIYDEHGLRGLAERKAPGREPSLSPTQKKKLENGLWGKVRCNGVWILVCGHVSLSLN